MSRIHSGNLILVLSLGAVLLTPNGITSLKEHWAGALSPQREDWPGASECNKGRRAREVWLNWGVGPIDDGGCPD